MDYEKKYNEALERARQIKDGKDEWRYSDLAEITPALTDIFPELAESEDERIRAVILKLVLGMRDEIFTTADKLVTKPKVLTYLERLKEQNLIMANSPQLIEQKPIIQDVELNDAVYDYVRDHFIAGADFTPEYIKKLMENAFFAGVDYYLLKQEFESCEPDTNVEKVIEDVIRVYGKTQGDWVGGYDVDALIVNLRRAFNKKEQKPVESISQLTVQGKGVYKICPRCKSRMIRDDSKVYTSMPPQYGYECPKCGEMEFDTVKYDNPEMEEQKLTEWSKNDTVFLNEITDFFENKTVRLQHDIDMYAHWLKSLPERFVLRSKQEWSAEDEMETINVFRPLAGTSIESATKQAVNKFTNSGKKFLLAFNGVFILIDNTKSVQDIVSEYNRSLGGKKNEQGQSEGEPNDFEITLNDCMLAAQQYPPGKIGLDVVKMWAKELSNYCPQPNQKWSEFDRHCLERAIWYVENPAPNVIKDTNLVLWLKSLRPSWKPSEEQMEALKCAVEDVAKFSKRGGRQVELENEPYYSALHSLYCNLEKLM